MAEMLGTEQEPPGPVFEGIPEPESPQVVVLAHAMQGPPLPTPQQMLKYDYDDVEWENFTVEWVRELGPPYRLVTRLGGAGDRGADIAACLTSRGTAGEWHCFQCKHYKDALAPSDAWPEVVKIFTAKIQGTYELPTRYIFVAPKIGSSLTRWLANPSNLKAKFFDAWEKENSPLGVDLSPSDRKKVETLAHETDFSMFESVDMEWVLEMHSRTPHHARRFPKPLPRRPLVESPPSEQAAKEAIYIQKLLDAYNEKYGLAMQSLQEARDNAKSKRHLIRQREAFYSAESLRVFARESVPEATFKAIEADLFEAVIDLEERDYEIGYERLEAVLHAAANHLPNPANILSPVVTGLDRKGLCHHLANDDRLTWCKGETS